MPVGSLLSSWGTSNLAFTMTFPPCSKAAPTREWVQHWGPEVAESECELHRVVEGCHKVDVDVAGSAWDPSGHVDS